MRRQATALSGVAWLAVVGWLTLRSNPVPRTALAPPWACVLCGDGGTTDFVLNLLLYAPFGLIARAARWPLGRLAVCAFALALSIEVYQGTALVGRDATLGDVVANTTGALLGWLLAGGFGALRTAPVRARAAAVAVLACQCLIWLGTGFGMHPSLSGPAPWVGRFSPVGKSADPFEGTIQRVSLDGIAVTMDPMARLPGKADTLDLAVALTRTTSRPPKKNASIVRLLDNSPKVFLRVTQIGQGINVEVPLAASRWLLRTPDWRYPAALDIPVGKPWQFEWRRHPNSVEMTSAPASALRGATHQSLPVSIGLGWAWVHPFVSAIDDSAPWWTALWIASWFALLGWTGGWGGQRFSALMLVCSIAIFIAAGTITSLPVTAGELVAALAGYGVGWLGASSWLKPRLGSVAKATGASRTTEQTSLR